MQRIRHSLKIPFHQHIVIGVELESYTILIPDYRISREILMPRKGVGEKGERFKRDASIGSEYNSQPFFTIREGLFLLKAGLRKYNDTLYRRKSLSKKRHHVFLTGGWRDRFAGAHLHLSLADRDLSRDDARRFAYHLHDHIPFLIAMGANSPVWADEITDIASNRVALATKTYFKPIERGELTSRWMDELLYSRGRKTKPPTVELRVLDSNIPEFIMAVACLIKAIAIAWLNRKRSSNRIPMAAYLRSREEAARLGMKAKLCWNGEWIPATQYLDRFVWEYREELQEIDIPEEVSIALRLIKRGYNGSRLLTEAAQLAYDEHPQTWQRRFAKRYVQAIHALLSGNSLLDFAQCLKVKVPDIDRVWIGRRHLKVV